MSIFKDSFHESIRGQLETRQSAINNRTPQNLQYLNSRNAWIRLSSSVNVLKKGVQPTPQNLVTASNYDNTLAKQYVLQGGILNDGKHRAGLGDFSYAYSNVGSDGEPYRLGIRPMPGITGVDIKSKGAYGSLRYATVNFNAWDIKQLEELELLYMRPGYSVLLEWGWSPYLDNLGSYTTTLDYTDIIDTDWTKEELFKRQYARATNGIYFKEDGTKVTTIGYQGNCDSMFGMIKNYSWKARMDGGYDCSMEIISMGEVIESLKVNYAPMDTITNITTTGLITPNLDARKDGTRFGISPFMDLSGSYSQNVLAGVFGEMWGLGLQIGGDAQKGVGFTFHDKKYNCFYDVFRKVINIKGGEKGATGTGKVGQSDEQVYITLEGLVNILNNYVLLRDKKSGKPFVPLSVLEANVSSSNPITGDGYLLALAHPLEVSVDPTVCLIKSPLWMKGIKINAVASGSATDPKTGAAVADSGPYGKSKGGDIYNDTWWKTLAAKVTAANTERLNGPLTKDLQSYVTGYANGDINEVKDMQRRFLQIKNATSSPDKELKNIKIKSSKTLGEYSSLYDLLDEGIGSTFDNSEEVEIGIAFGTNTKLPTYDTVIDASKKDPAVVTQEQLEAEKEKLDEQNKAVAESVENIQFLNILQRPYFINNDWSKELGIIGNIYINVNMLFNLSVNSSLEAQDKKEKSDISVYDFMKNVLAKISPAIGDVNNFDIFIDPDTNIARIIDVNYVDRLEAETAYDKAFQLEIHNLNSVVRSYSLESKIFQEQTAIVAVGAQVGGGKLGVDTSTLVDFNRSIMDRIIPVKDAPSAPDVEPDDSQKLDTLIAALSIISEYFNKFKTHWWGDDSDFLQDEADKYKNALKDIITFFKALGASKIKNKAILPTVLSVNMDGIGGIIIGNLFKINSDILPKGYKNLDANGIGSKLGYIVTGIGHSLKNSDWETKLEAQTIILENPKGMDIKFAEMTLNKDGVVEATIVTSTNSAGEIFAVGTSTTAGGEAYDHSAVATYYKNKGYTNGQLPDAELVYLNTDDASSNRIHRLHPKAAAQWQALILAARAAGFTKGKFNVSYLVEAAYRDRASQKSGPGHASPGHSPHGWGGAVDIQQLYSLQKQYKGGGYPAGREAAQQTRGNSALYAWLSTNGPTYGWYNPSRLFNGATSAEAWHFEYWGPI